MKRLILLIIISIFAFQSAGVNLVLSAAHFESEALRPMAECNFSFQKNRLEKVAEEKANDSQTLILQNLPKGLVLQIGEICKNNKAFLKVFISALPSDFRIPEYQLKFITSDNKNLGNVTFYLHDNKAMFRGMLIKDLYRKQYLSETLLKYFFKFAEKNGLDFSSTYYQRKVLTCYMLEKFGFTADKKRHKVIFSRMPDGKTGVFLNPENGTISAKRIKSQNYTILDKPPKKEKTTYIYSEFSLSNMDAFKKTMYSINEEYIFYRLKANFKSSAAGSKSLFVGTSIDELRQDLLSHMKEYDESANSIKSYVEQQAPELKDYTVASLQFEAGVDRGLLEKLIMKDDEFARFVAQVTMTGGLGALMHDLPCAWKKNGVDVVSINPLYNSYIKGDVVHYDKETGQMKPGMPMPKNGKSLGDKIKNVLDDTGILFDFTLDSQEFMKYSNSASSKNAAGRNIYIHAYDTVTKYGNAPVYYIDAYYLNDDGSKAYIFDQVYPDDDFRDFQMAVFNEAQQRLLKLLQKHGTIKNDILFVENEVYVTLPKKQFPNSIRHHINHTVWEPGMHKPPEYAFSLMGFDESIRDLIVANGEINIAEYAALTADAISGVGLYEHTGVLKDKIFQSYSHKIAQHSEGGMRNTNGALLDQWQGEEVRMLINQYKDKLGLDKIADDKEFYSALDRSKRDKASFLKKFEMIKVLYSLELLYMLYKTQKQDMGGSNWLKEILEDSKLELNDIDKILDSYKSFIYKGLSGRDVSWLSLHRKFGGLMKSILSAPMIANVRRQVVYKGPDKYLELLRYFEANKEALDAFRASGARLIIGGRIFDSGVRYLFEKELKQIAKRLGMEDRIAFIENYNIADAPDIFKGVAATIMLSDEFLEASATSMMKGVTNAAALVGVFGGAMPELFNIVDTETGEVVDVLNQDITYDDIEAGLKSGKYIIPNGYLVMYSSLSDEKSHEKLGKRRPNAASLLKCITTVGTTYADEKARRELIFDVLANSYRVDMERSQARAHIHIWGDLITKRKNFTSLIKRFMADDTIEKLSQLTGSTDFVWKYKKYPTAEWKLSLDVDTGKSLLSFLDSFRRVRSSKEGFNSFLYHCSKRRVQSKQAKKYGDVLAYLLDILSADAGPTSLRSILLEMIDKDLESLDSNIKDVDLIKEKALLTLKVMDFTDNMVRALTKYSSIGSIVSRLISEPGSEKIALTKEEHKFIREVGPLDMTNETGAADLLKDEHKKLSAIQSAA